MRDGQAGIQLGQALELFCPQCNNPSPYRVVADGDTAKAPGAMIAHCQACGNEALIDRMLIAQ